MKILIINENRHNSIGGIEKYTRMIAQTFHDLGHEVYEYAFNLNPERIDMFDECSYIKPLNKIHKTDKPISLFVKRKYIKQAITDIKKSYDKFDLIINQTANVKWFNDFYKSKKVIYVQHFNPDFYKQKYTAGVLMQPIIYFGMWLVGIKNPFKSFQNFVVFTNDDKKELKINDDKKVWTIPLASYSIREIKNNVNNRKEKIIYFGRIDNRQKNIKRIVKFANKNMLYIDFYGEGNTKFIKGKYCRYMGKIDGDIRNVVCRYKYSILLSKYEGFPFSVVESLSLGVPVIISRFCPSANWLSKNKGFIVSNNLNFSINGLSNIEYNNLCTECINFGKLYLSVEQFTKNWTNVLKEFN